MVLGLSGPELTNEEREFFAASQPLGFILFARNIFTPSQAQALVQELREAVGRDDAPVMVDQEGGRVARLQPPHWHALPAAGAISALQGDDARNAAWLTGRLIAHDLRSIGADIACAPVLDVLQPGLATDVIGDRSYGREPERVIFLGRAMAEGLAAGGVLPIVKHIPGHGRAEVDSHHKLPVVTTSTEQLIATDFFPFKQLCHLPIAMTAHIVYSAIDASLPATLSAPLIKTWIREKIGFDGFLMTDDLSMHALTGTLKSRAEAAVQAGCDLVLHCNGNLQEMQEVADATPTIEPGAWQRWLEIPRHLPQPFDVADALETLSRLMDRG